MDVTAAIADPVRREILVLLRGRTLTAGEIADRFDISRPAVSRHLRVLRECGLVVDEARGRERIYRLDTAPLAPLEAWLAQLHDRWSGPLDALETEVYRTRRERRAAPSTPEERSA
ncbi:MAG TPA: metalloregulator ArsR/SmtB family transcription factor [Longimicrobiaceae bacterium]|nr:metalloregulator ArsR/SmtB family transcription factor [Longimicrobiaceae bacterium]